MPGEIIYDHDDGSISVVASGDGAPQITGSFRSYDEYRQLNSSYISSTEDLCDVAEPSQGLISKALGMLGLSH